MHDSLVSFLFEDLPFHGKLVSLDSTWKKIIQDKNYPPEIERTLSAFCVCNALLSSTLKYTGSMQITLSGEDSLKLLVSECRDDLSIRAMAKVDSKSLKPFAIESCSLAITLDLSDSAQRYQSLVPINSPNCEQIFESYLEHSEQLPSSLRFIAYNSSHVGILLQKFPNTELSESETVAQWKRLRAAIQSCDEKFPHSASAAELLQFIFPEDDLRILPERSVTFRCNCSRERIEAMVLGLGKEDAELLLEEEGGIFVHCEFCGKEHRFDAVDVAAAFSEPPPNGH